MDLFHYAVYHTKAIAHNIGDIDLAMRWGFGWQKGPFEIWQSFGFVDVLNELNSAITNKKTYTAESLPEWLSLVSSFYQKDKAYNPSEQTYTVKSSLPIYKKQHLAQTLQSKFSENTIYENEGLILWHVQDDIALLSFKSKANSIGQAVIDGFFRALEHVESQYQGLIIYQNDASHFCVGANLFEVSQLIQAKKMNALESMLAEFQKLCLRVKYATVPVVAAVRGQALGGGCELLMHCSRVMAAFESYPGLVEVGVGLIPAGGGTKEMALRASAKAETQEVFPWVQNAFDHIIKGTVATSALDAFKLGYFKPTDHMVMNANEVLFAAVSEIKNMNHLNYIPPMPPKIRVAGLEGVARLKLSLINWFEGNFISQHDYFICEQIAKVICGGEINQNEFVDEAWLLNLEREAFMTLAAMPLTQARINHILETGKPLRN